MCSMDQASLGKKNSLGLAVFDGDKGNFREKETFQWISKSNSVY